MTLFWIDENGAIIQATSDDVKIKDVPGAVEAITEPPESGRQIWNGISWDAVVLSQADLITAALAGTETVAQVARKVEDLIDHIVNGAPLDPALETWRADRADKRQNV